MMVNMLYVLYYKYQMIATSDDLPQETKCFMVIS